ncbi:MAG: lysylphosphatidylglycerol synthase domain-containing protein [bacterium]
MRAGTRKAAGLAIRLLVTGLFLAYALTRVDLQHAAESVSRTAWWGTAGAALLMLLNMGLQVFRWHLVAHAGGLGLRLPRSAAMVAAGFPLGLLTPGRMGELGRGMAVEGGHDALSVAGLTALERGFGMLGGLGLAAAAMVLSGYGEPWKWTLIGVLYASALALALSPRRLARLLGLAARLVPGRPGEWVEEMGARLLAGWRMAGRRAAVQVLLLSVVQVSVVIVQLSLCYLAAASGEPPLKVAGAWAVVLGAKYLLPVTVGDLGVREGLAVAVFTDRAMDPAPALLAALTIYLLNVLLPAAAGALVLARRRRPV